MWKLVLYAIFYLGSTSVKAFSVEEKEYNSKKNVPFAQNLSSNISYEPTFTCQDKPSGYYADPRFSCELFHYCHVDGTRVTIPCFLGNQKHRICLLKDAAKGACDGNELVFPEDTTLKASKQTSALNDATEYKLPYYIEEPTLTPEEAKPTTPLSFETKDKSESKLKEINSVYEVFNSFLKEIQASKPSSDHFRIDNSSSKPKPSTFSRRSRMPSSLEQNEESVFKIGKRSDENDALLVEIYNDAETSDQIDYSPYRRSTKTFRFVSDKKSQQKLPKRKKRMVPEQFSASQPYAIIYAKVPDTTLASSNDFHRRNAVRSRQNYNEVPFSPAAVPSHDLAVPVAVEVRKRKKGKSKLKSHQHAEEFRKSIPIEERRQGQTTSEQQNVYYYSPEHGRNTDPHRNIDGRTVSVPHSRGPESDVQAQGDIQSRQGSLQQNPQLRAQEQNRHLYSPQTGSSLPLPSFPFQGQPFLNSPRQTPFYYRTPGVQDDSFSPYGHQIHGQNQYLPLRFEKPLSETEQPKPTSPSETERPRQHGGHDAERTTERHAASQIAGGPQSFMGFQNPFFSNFPGFSAFSEPVSQPDPTSYGLLQPSLQPQPPQAAYQYLPQPVTQRERPQLSSPGRPQQLNIERPQHQIRPEPERPEAPQFIRNQSPYIHELRDTERRPNRYAQEQATPLQPSHLPIVMRDPKPEYPFSPYQSHSQDVSQNQDLRGPVSEFTSDRNIRRPSQVIGHSHREIFQPQHQPDSMIVLPERPSVTPTRNRTPRPNTESVPMRDVKPQQAIRSQNIGEHNKNIYRQREESTIRGNGQDRRKKPEEQNITPSQRQQSAYYHSPTMSPPSSRTRSHTSYPVKEEIRNQRTRPEKEDISHSVNEEQQTFGHRTPTSSPIRYTRTRTSNKDDLSEPMKYHRPSDVNNRYTNTEDRSRENSRYQGGSRRRPSDNTRAHPERPLRDYVPPRVLDPPHGPPEYHQYLPHGNDVNVISNADETHNKHHRPTSITSHYPSSQRDTHVPVNLHNYVTPQPEVEFVSHAEKSQRIPHYQTQSPNDEYTVKVENYRRPENIVSNHYQSLTEDTPTTRYITTTRPPVRKPLPPKPTFPPFPTFPPPPRRPVTPSRPRKEENNFTRDTLDYTKSNPDHHSLSTSSSIDPSEAFDSVERIRHQDITEDKNFQTSTPEATTRRRTRKRRPRPRKPKQPIEVLTEAGQYLRETVTEPSKEREVTTRTTSGRTGSRWRQVTTAQPRRASISSATDSYTTTDSSKTEEFGSRINLFGRSRNRKPSALQPRIVTTTPSPTLLREESVRVSNTPNVLRERKPYKKRVRVKVTTTTSEPETVAAIARSDENSELLNFQLDEVTTPITESSEYEVTSQPSMNELLVTEIFSTTESYNDMLDVTENVAVSESDDSTDSPLDGDNKTTFESTRSVIKKFQNRPRILKFGKPKLRTTLPPLSLNSA